VPGPALHANLAWLLPVHQDFDRPKDELWQRHSPQWLAILAGAAARTSSFRLRFQRLAATRSAVITVADEPNPFSTLRRELIPQLHLPGSSSAGQADQAVGGLQRDPQLRGDFMGHALLPRIGQAAGQPPDLGASQRPAAQQLPDHPQLGGHRPRFLGHPPAQQADQLIIGGIRAPALWAGQLIQHHPGPRPGRAPVPGVALRKGRQPGVPAAGQPGAAAGLFALAASGTGGCATGTTSSFGRMS
jgi:hypothetical protein